MPELRVFILPLAAVAVILTAADGVDACIDPTMATVQAAAASGASNSVPQCGPPPVEVSDVAASGGSFWGGTGRGLLGRNEMDYTYTLAFGFWGYATRTLGTFFLPDLIITGSCGVTADIAVNVVIAGTASGDFIPASQDVQIGLALRNQSGTGSAGSGNSQLVTSYSPNADPQVASLPAITGVPVNTPFTLELSASWFSAGPPFGSGLTTIADGYVELLDTEVFQLPAGCTLNSNSGGIVDNQIPGSPPLVPTLSGSGAVLMTLLLLSLGLFRLMRGPCVVRLEG